MGRGSGDPEYSLVCQLLQQIAELDSSIERLQVVARHQLPQLEEMRQEVNRLRREVQVARTQWRKQAALATQKLKELTSLAAELQPLAGKLKQEQDSMTALAADIARLHTQRQYLARPLELDPNLPPRLRPRAAPTIPDGLLHGAVPPPPEQPDPRQRESRAAVQRNTAAVFPASEREVDMQLADTLADYGAGGMLASMPTQALPPGNPALPQPQPQWQQPTAPPPLAAMFQPTQQQQQQPAAPPQPRWQQSAAPPPLAAMPPPATEQQRPQPIAAPSSLPPAPTQLQAAVQQQSQSPSTWPPQPLAATPPTVHEQPPAAPAQDQSAQTSDWVPALPPAGSSDGLDPLLLEIFSGEPGLSPPSPAALASCPQLLALPPPFRLPSPLEPPALLCEMELTSCWQRLLLPVLATP